MNIGPQSGINDDIEENLQTIPEEAKNMDPGIDADILEPEMDMDVMEAMEEQKVEEVPMVFETEVKEEPQPRPQLEVKKKSSKMSGDSS